MLMIYLVIFQFNLVNGVIATLGTAIPFAILVISEGNMTPDQLSYTFVMPFIFLVMNKRNREIDLRRDFYQNKTLQTNRRLMQETLKRYFGESLT